MIGKLAALLGLAFVGTQANAADFWRARSGEGLIILVDGDRTGKQAGDLVTAVFYMNGPPGMPMRAELQAEFKCAARQVRVTKTILYNAKFEPVPDLKPPGAQQWEEADAGGTGKVLTDFACRPRTQWPGLGDRLTETSWQEAMKRQLPESGGDQAPEAGRVQK